MIRFLLLLLAATPLAAQEVDPLDPKGWSAEDVAMLARARSAWGSAKRERIARSEMVSGSTSPRAIYAGTRALRAGGTAVDAALTTAFTQIAEVGGCWVSYAGIFSLVYYDAASGKVHALDAGYQSLRGETSPLTIPKSGTASGRSALVPGFFAGAEAARARFGKLPMARLLKPSIHLAEHGLVVDRVLASLIASKAAVLKRHAGDIFFAGGRPLGVGARLKQPALARTLRAIAANPRYQYEGEWARKFVAAARAEGSAITAEELADYRATWSRGLRTTYRGREVIAPAWPSDGGIKLIEALELLQHVDLPKLGRPMASGESLRRIVLTMRTGTMLTLLGPRGRTALLKAPRLDPRPLRGARAKALWSRMLDPAWRDKAMKAAIAAYQRGANHSDAVVAIDAAGNVAALTHSINTTSWGSTGLFVDGISIPDSAAIQQRRLQRIGAGARVPNEMVPTIVLKDGKPVLATSTIGAGLHQVNLLQLLRVLDFGIEPQGAIDLPQILGPAYSKMRFDAQYLAGEWPAKVVEAAIALGQPLSVNARAKSTGQLGYWVAAWRDGKVWRSGNSKMTNGLALGR